jgi:hypothetical protein
VFSNDFAPSVLALTSPPKRGCIKENLWAETQYARAEMTSEELRKSCEQETVDAYTVEIEERVKEPEGANGGGGGWGPTNAVGRGNRHNDNNTRWSNLSGDAAETEWRDPPNATNRWTIPPSNPSGRGNASTLLTPDRPPHSHVVPNHVDLSQLGSEKRIREISDIVIEGLKTMQIQPCFMREVRRFVVIDSAARAKEFKPAEIEACLLLADSVADR